MHQLYLHWVSQIDSDHLIFCKPHGVFEFLEYFYPFSVPFPNRHDSAGLVVGVSKLGDNVWELAEQATAAAGAPLAVLCILIPFQANDRWAAGVGAFMAQTIYLTMSVQNFGEMPFLWAILFGGMAYIIIKNLWQK